MTGEPIVDNGPDTGGNKPRILVSPMVYGKKIEKLIVPANTDIVNSTNENINMYLCVHN